MTKDQFISKSEAMSRALSIRALILLGLFLGALFGCGLFLDPWEKRYGTRWSGAIFLIWLLVTGAALFLSLLRQINKLSRQFELCCGSCGRLFTGRLTLLTGNCPHCGHRVLADVPFPNTYGGPEKVSRLEFRAKLEVSKKKESRRQLVLLGVCILTVMVCIPSAGFLDYLQGRGKLDWAMTMNMHWVAGITGAVIALSLVFVVLYSLLRTQKHDGVPCPNCKKPLFGIKAHIAIATRACPECGEIILS